MKQEMIYLLNQGDYDKVLNHIAGLDAEEYDETVAVVAASAYMGLGDYSQGMEMIQLGLAMNPRHYELYLMLGQIMEEYHNNVNQAYLCYENAALYCESQEDLEIIHQFMERAKRTSGFGVRNYSIVILSYNNCEITRGCIDSIRKNTSPEGREIIVVDNASEDDTPKWLVEQNDIILQLNEVNEGFPKGSNQGANLANLENDILFLNNDVVVYPNSIFWLRMGLYADGKIGASSCMTNFSGNHQCIACDCTTDEEYEMFAKSIHLPDTNVLEYKLYLTGFALLLKRACIDRVGLFDERFSPGQFEDNDLGLRIIEAGWKNVLCHNCFIRHYGHGNGLYEKKWTEGFQVNQVKFREKWGFSPFYYAYTRMDLIECIDKDKNDDISVLEIGCGLGATMMNLKYQFPNARVKGIELEDKVANLGAMLQEIVQGNVERDTFPFEDERFDYIILGNVLENLYNPEEVLKKLIGFLNRDGCIICSIPNVMHTSIILPLLRGHFNYGEEGPLDYRNIRFFTLESIKKMFANVGCCIDEISYTEDGTQVLPEIQDFLDWIDSKGNYANKKMFTAYQYILRARKHI